MSRASVESRVKTAFMRITRQKLEKLDNTWGEGLTQGIDGQGNAD